MSSFQLNLTHHILRNTNFCIEIEQYMKMQRITDKQRFKIITCILEALGNVVTHTQDNVCQTILIVQCTQDRIIVDLLDDSPVPDLPEKIDCPDTNELSGRGLWVMNNWMDQVRYQPTVMGSHLRLSLLRH